MNDEANVQEFTGLCPQGVSLARMAEDEVSIPDPQLKTTDQSPRPEPPPSSPSLLPPPSQPRPVGLRRIGGHR